MKDAPSLPIPGRSEPQVLRADAATVMNHNTKHKSLFFFYPSFFLGINLSCLVCDITQQQQLPSAAIVSCLPAGPAQIR